MRFILSVLLLTALPCFGTPAIGKEEHMPSPDDPRVIARIKVSEPGFYRIPRAFLAQARVNPAQLRVRRGGVPVPMCTHVPEGDVVFLAADVAASHSRSAVYELLIEPRAPKRSAPPPKGEAEPEPLTSTRRFDRDHIFGPLASAVEEDKSKDPSVNVRVYDGDVPNWFLGKIAPGQGFSFPLDPSGAAKGTDQTLEVHCYGTRLGEVALAANYAGKDLGKAVVERINNMAGGAKIKWHIPADVIPDDPTLLILKDVSFDPPPPPRNDVSNGRGSIWIDSISLTGEVNATIDSKLRVFNACPNAVQSFKVYPQADAEIAAYLCLVGPAGNAIGLPSVAAQTVGGETHASVQVGDVDNCCFLYASSKVTDATLEHVTTLKNPASYARRARHVIIAVPELMEECERLAAHRRQEGIPSVVTPVNDIYMSFGHGEKSPAAIRRFLVTLMERKEEPLEFVLLAGDATYDRTDLLEIETIPTMMSRTMYNGATSSDVLYVEPPAGSGRAAPAIGRLPFREAAPMKAYVDRLIAYETKPPVDASRRMMRFITSEGRFGAFVDAQIERLFRNLISTELSPAFDIEITFASVSSSFLWPPPEFNAKVIDSLNEGALFYTYMGHGFALGFDALRAGNQRYPILTIHDAKRIDIKGTPPALLVVACTTAIFDIPHQDGVGEAIMKQPNGPVAYWGATRICHPAGNALLGRSIAQFMAKQEGELRLGQILAKAGAYAVKPEKDDIGFKTLRMMARMLAGLKTQEEMDRLALEGVWLYSLIGDPALKIAFPKRTIDLAATFDEATLSIVVEGTSKLPDGTQLQFTLEHPRNRNPHALARVTNVLDPAQFPVIRENHRRSNDWVIERRSAALKDGKARIEFPLAGKTKGLVVKVWALTGDDVHHGAIVLPKRAP